MRAESRREHLREAGRQRGQIKRSVLARADPELWAEELRRLHEKRRALEVTLAQQPPGRRWVELDESLAPQIAARLLETVQAADVDERRQFIRAFVRRITLDPEESRALVECAATAEPLARALQVVRGGLIAGVVAPTGFEPVFRP